MSVSRVSVLCEGIISRLRSSGYEDDAASLEKLVRSLADQSTAADALNQIIVMCHPKALGDLQLPSGPSPVEWINTLGRVDREAKRTIKAINHT